jgi:16S rRNA (guanine527-N7)-methyltransferase
LICLFEGSLVIPGRTALESLLKGCGVSLAANQLDSLWHYHQLLRAANAKLNLTRIHNFERMVVKHYADSLLVLNYLELPSPLIDMGSGPGLPGIPLAIARPGTQIILAESRGSRAEFLMEICKRLRLGNVEVYAHKLGPDYPATVRGVITRAVGTIAGTLERVMACLGSGDKIIFMKGPRCDHEIEEAEHRAHKFFELAADHHYRIPGTPHDRRLVIYQRLPIVVPVNLRISARGSGIDRPRRELSSETNPSFRIFRDLLTGRGVRKHGQALMAGPRIIAELLDLFAERALAWITDDSQDPPAGRESLEWYRLSKPLFNELDVTGTNSPLLLVTVPPLPEWSDDEPWPEGCTLFIPFQDPENVGAAIRSAAAFEVARVVLLKESAHPFHPRSSRAAGPALFQVALQTGPSIHELGARGVPLIALDTSGPALDESPFPARFGLVIGLEGPGLPQRLRQGQRRRIPISSRVESLNAAAAAAVALYDWSRQRPATR